MWKLHELRRQETHPQNEPESWSSRDRVVFSPERLAVAPPSKVRQGPVSSVPGIRRDGTLEFRMATARALWQTTLKPALTLGPATPGGPGATCWPGFSTKRRQVDMYRMNSLPDPCPHRNSGVAGSSAARKFASPFTRSGKSWCKMAARPITTKSTPASRHARTSAALTVLPPTPSRTWPRSSSVKYESRLLPWNDSSAGSLNTSHIDR